MKYRNLKFVSSFILGIYLLMLCSWMFIGFGRIRRHSNPEYMYNLEPFSTIHLFLQTDQFNTEIWVINIFGNIGVFVPFGILLPLVSGKKFMKSFIIFFIGLLILELLQLLSRRGSFDIDDLILNSVGFLFGYGLYRILTVIRR